MKKWTIAALLALLTMLLCTASAEDGHNWQWRTTDKAHVRYCAGCATHSDVYNDESSIASHTYRCIWPDSEPNGGQGYAYITTICEVCDWSANTEVKLIRGKDPTCMSPGIHTYEYKGNYNVPDKNRTKTYTIPAVEHKFSSYERNHDATCTKNETETARCIYSARGEKCTATDTRDIPNSMLEHALEPHDAKAPTCTEIGWDAYESCKNCDYTTRAIIPALNHDLVVGNTKAPTCTEAGYKILICQHEGCDYTTRVDVPALNHDIVKHDAKAPTCTEIGWEAYEDCQREGCDYSTRVTIDALDHDLVLSDAKAPTCTEKGWNEYVCQREGCDYTTYNELAALGHDYESRTVKPTCTEDGYTRHTCTRCGDKYTDSRTEKLWHWFGEWTSNAESTESIHSALCLRGCGYTGEALCTPVEFPLTAEGEDAPFSLTLCPVCGEYMDGAVLELIEGVTAKPASEKDVLPTGEPVLRMGALESGNVVMSIAFEYDGHPVQPTGAVTFTLPAGLLEGYALSLVNADGTVAPLDAETDGETASFTLDFTDLEAPVLLIRLIPAA